MNDFFNVAYPWIVLGLLLAIYFSFARREKK